MQILMNKPVYLGLIILEISKIVMYQFWYDYIKAEYRQKWNYVTYIKKAI